MSAPVLIDLVIGTRPNIIKAAPLYRALLDSGWAMPRLVFLQQHTDPALAAHTIEDVGLATADITAIALDGRHFGDRLGSMIQGYADRLATDRPHLVAVFGDVDTTLAAAIAAKRTQCRLAHVEAGLRSHDRSMPEELNRLMVDAITDVHLATTEEARQTLLREGHRPECVHFVGNLMIDSLLQTVDRAFGATLCQNMGIPHGRFILATFHRPANVDTAEGLTALADMLEAISAQHPVVFPMHPRTRDSIERAGLSGRFVQPDLHILPPIRYRHFVNLQAAASAIVSDSGGIQEEASVLGVPCLTVRDSTERPDTLSAGNELIQPGQAAQRLSWLLSHPQCGHHAIPLWDGHSASRIVDVLRTYCQPT